MTSQSPEAQNTKILLIILAILLPPLAVYMKNERVDNEFWLNVVLTLLCAVPGQIHAIIVSLRD